MVTDEWVIVGTISREPPQARAILMHIKNQIDIARLQFTRIREETIKSDQLLKMHKEYSELQRTMRGSEKEETWAKALSAYRDWSGQYAVLYADYQFLTIILGRLYLLMRKLKCLLQRHRELHLVWKKYHKWLEAIRKYRGGMEHTEALITRPNMDIDSYLIGVGYEFMLNDRTIDFNHAEKELEAFFDDLLMALKP